MARSYVHVFLLIATFGCGPQVKQLEPNLFFDTETESSETLLPPLLAGAPASYPYPVLAVRGVADSTSVVITPAGANSVTAHTIDGAFCGDVEFPAAGQYNIKVQAQSIDGALSEPQEFTVSYAPGADVAGYTRCDGSSPKKCPGNIEICGNNVDDNCNGLIDAQDPSCNPANACPRDFPPRSSGVALSKVGRFPGVILCGKGDTHHFAFQMRAGQKLLAKASVPTGSNAIVFQLFDTVDKDNPRTTADGDSNSKTLEYNAIKDGLHEIRIVSTRDGFVSYAMEISIN